MKNFDWAGWVTRLVLNLWNVAQVAFFAYLAIDHVRKGEDVWAAIDVALVLMIASQFADKESQ